MPLTSPRAMFERAYKEGYAIGAFNVNNMEIIQGIMEAGTEEKAPLILQVSAGARKYAGQNYIVKLIEAGLLEADLPVVLHLDHGADFDICKACVDGGFTSVMIDGSHLPYEENVKEVSEIVKIAHAMGVSVEAELGHVGQGDNYAVDGKTALTDPEEAKKYIEETGVDMLAVAIGTAHGEYVGTPHIDFDRLVEIKKATGNFPLVLHGGSGSGDENLRKVCQMGINKVNVCNDLMRAACDTVTAADLSGNGAYGLWGLIQKGWKARLKELIEVFGGVGKAWKVEPKGMPKTGETNLEEK